MPLEPDNTVLEELGSGWVLCQKQNIQGDIFFFNCETHEVSESPPAEINVATPPDALPPSEASTRASTQRLSGPVVKAPMEEMQIQQPPATVMAECGNWLICEDSLGEFYYHVPTNQAYDEPPPELVYLYQQQEEEHRNSQLEQLRQQLHLHEQLKLKQRPQVQQPVLVQQRVVGSTVYPGQPAPPVRSVVYRTLQPTQTYSYPTQQIVQNPVQQTLHKASYVPQNLLDGCNPAVACTYRSGQARYRH